MEKANELRKSKVSRKNTVNIEKYHNVNFVNKHYIILLFFSKKDEKRYTTKSAMNDINTTRKN